MISKLLWRIVRATRLLWLRALLFAIVAILAALLGPALSPWLDADFGDGIGSEAVGAILTILASSMLTVTTFSLSVMVQALGTATSSVTPRAVPVLLADQTTQNALSTFLGAFLFSLAGIILLESGFYSDSARVILYGVTLVVVALIVLTMVRWIEHLRVFGRVTTTTSEIEAVVAEALDDRAAAPALGGHPLTAGSLPSHAHPVHPDRIGYVQHVDPVALQRLAEAEGALIYLAALPGSFVHGAAPLAHCVFPDAAPAPDRRDDFADALRAAFELADRRSYDTDPRFGLAVLTEIAQRALSPAVNDPGTAIDVIGRHVRLLSGWAGPHGPATISHNRLWVPPLDPQDLIEDCFAPIARDGAAMLEVQLRLLKGLDTLARMHPDRFGAPARAAAAIALARSRAAGALPVDLQRLLAVAPDGVEPPTGD